MKKRLGILSIIFVLIPFGVVFYLIYSLLGNQSVSLLNSGIELNIVENSFSLSFDENIIFAYIGIYLLLASLIAITSKIRLGKKISTEREQKAHD